jgi:hypothetical protein
VIAARTYVLDANVFIEAKRRYYAFDLCPGFWESLIWHHSRRRVYSIDRVKTELMIGGDDLTEWVKKVISKDCFLPTDDETVQRWFAQMVEWVQSRQQYLHQAKADFAAKADGWLIALAKARGFALVTHEEAAPEARKTVPIPNVSHEFDVQYVNTFQMLRELATSFHWKAPG